MSWSDMGGLTRGFEQGCQHCKGCPTREKSGKAPTCIMASPVQQVDFQCGWVHCDTSDPSNGCGQGSSRGSGCGTGTSACTRTYVRGNRSGGLV
jgi:hypothetical protein